MKLQPSSDMETLACQVENRAETNQFCRLLIEVAARKRKRKKNV